MRMNDTLKKVLSALLCLCMLVQNAPIVAFAADGDGLCEHHTEHTPECHYAEAAPGSDCTHQCAEDCAEGCVHTAHDDACGYSEAVEAHDCHYQCAECAAAPLPSDEASQEEPAVEEAPVCDCGTDDPAHHATFCTAYVAPEDPQCYCAEKCGVEAQNFWCDVCGVDYAACTGGSGEGVAYADAAQITGVSITVDDVIYTSGNVTITPTSTVVYTVTGTNFAALSEDNYLLYTYLECSYLTDDVWVVDTAANTATWDLSADIDRFGACDGFEVHYSNYGSSFNTGIFLTYVRPTPDSTGKVVVDVKDEYLDGWSKAAIEIYKNGQLAETATVDEGTAYNTVSMDLDSTASYAFKWVKGRFDEECSFTIYMDGEEKLKVPDASVYADGETILTLGDDTTGGETDPVCTCSVKCSEGSVDSECAVCSADLTGCTGEEPAAEATRVIYVDESTYFPSGYSDFYDADYNELTVVREELEDGWVKYTIPADAKYYFTYDGNVGGGGTTFYPELPTNADSYDPFSGTWSCSHPGYEEGVCTLCGETCAHTGGEATCGQQAVCTICGAGYGETPAHAMDDTTGLCSNGCGKMVAEASVTVGENTTYYGTLDAAIQAVSAATAGDNATVRLEQSIDLGDDYQDVSSGVFTLDLNGNTLSSGSYGLNIENAHVTITDSKEGGTLSGDSFGVYARNCTVEIKGGTVIGNNEGVDAYNCTVTISGGTVRGRYAGVYASNNSAVTISGGTVSGEHNGVEASDTTVTISGGTVKGSRLSSVCAYTNCTVTISGGTVGGGTNGVNATDGCTVKISDGTVSGEQSGVVAFDGTVKISGGEISGGYYGVTVDNSTAEISGGTVTGLDEGVKATNDCSVTISGGEISGEYYGVTVDNSTAEIRGGSLSGTDDIYSRGSTVTLTLGAEGVGATFPGGITVQGTTLQAILVEGAAYWCTADGKDAMITVADDAAGITDRGDITIRATCDHSGNTNETYTDNGDGKHSFTCTVCGATVTEDHTMDPATGKCVCTVQAAAKVNDFFNGNATYYYATLSEALAAAEALDNDGVGDQQGIDVYPLADHAGDFKISGLSTFFNGEGHTFSGAVTNEGSIDGGTFSGEVTNTGTINGGTFSGEVTNTGIIHGGTFSGKVINNGDIYNWISGAIELGENFSIENNGTIDCRFHFWKDGACRLCAEACDHSGNTNETYTNNGDGKHSFTCTVCGATVTEDHTMDPATGKCVCGAELAVASVTKSVAGGIGATTYYETLDAAIQAVSTCTAGDHATVKLLQDVDMGDGYQTISSGVFTLDLNGKTITGSYKIVLHITGGTVTIDDPANGGSIASTYTSAFGVTVRISGGTVNVADGTIYTSEESTLSEAVEVTSGNLTVSGGNIIGGSSGTGVFALGGSVTITGGSISGSDGVYSQDSTLTVTGGNISGHFALHISKGNTTITGGTITGSHYDIREVDDSSIALALADGKTQGATFPGGITVGDTTLNEVLGSDMAYWQGDKMIVPADGQIEITGGDVTIKAACKHENGTAAYAPTADGTQHIVSWSCCGADVTEDHTFTDGACTGCGVFGGYCGEEGNEQNVIWTYAGGTLTVGGTGAMADQSDPYNRPWEAYADQITTIVVNEGITTIGELAFCNLQQLTTVNLPDSLTTISRSAFALCRALKTVNLPANLKTIEGWAFQGCYALERVTLPEGLTTIGYRAFSECKNLTSVTVPASVTTIDEGAFGLSPATITVDEDNPNYSSDEHGVLFDKGKTTLIFCRTNIEAETYTIPSTVTKISESAFFECKDLVTIIIPKGVTTIGESAFSECTALTAITIPAGVTTIEFNTFSGCTSLTTVTILAGVTTIDLWAFSDCTALTTVTIPASVTSIHEDAFDNCNALATVNVPCTWDGSLYTFDESVTLNKVHDWVDGTCTLCGEVCDHSGNTNEATNNGNGTHSFECSVCVDTVIEAHTGGTATCTEQAECQHCGAGYGDLDPDNHTYESNVCCGYCGVPNVNGGKDVMWTLTDGKLTITGSGPMADHGDGTIDPWSDVKDGITSVAIGQGVTTIGTAAFDTFEALTAVELPEGMTTIGGYAFSYCGKLAEITIPSTVTVIGEYAFNATALTAVEIPAGVTTIGEGAFFHCRKLTEISIPNTVTTMGDYVFNQCKALTGITIPGSVKRIGELTFWNCTALETVTLDNGVETIGDSAFYGCTALKEITIPASVTSIERYAFRDCDALKEITIPASVTSIGTNAFSGCDALETANVSCGWAAKPLYTFADTVTVNIDEHTYENGKCSVCGAYDLWVAGEQITDSKLTVNGTTGTATYDPATDTLTLNGFDNGDKCYGFTNNEYPCFAAIFTMSDLNIVLVGENSLYVNIDSEGYKTAIQSSGGLTIGGEGSLDAGTENWCISAINGMTITGGTLDIYGTTVLDGPTTITGGNVSLNATDCVCYGTLTVNGGKVTVSTGSNYIESFGYPVVIGEGMAAYDKNGHVIENPDFKKLSYAQIKAAHVHSWTYTAEGDTITAICNGTIGECPEAEQTITICADGKTYDGTPVTAELEGSIDGVADPEIIYSGNTNAGTYTASIKLGRATATVEFTIEKATVTVTADAKSKTYGDADPELTYTVSGLVGEDKLTGALTRAEGENVGSYAITLGTLTAGDNYTVSFTGAEFAIGAKDVDVMTMEVEVTLEQDSYAYDGTAKEPKVTSIIVDGVKLTEDVDYRVLSYERNIYVGEAEVVIHFMGNYRGSLSRFFQITKAPLTVTADSKTMTTGQELPTFTYTITGFVGGESEDVLTAKPTVVCVADGKTAGTYDITVSGAAADNYEITHVNGTLSVIDHQHAWTYTAEGNTIIAICGNWATCADPEQTITLTAPESYTYSGEALYSASVDGSIDGVTYTVRYTGTDYSSADAPKDAGSYTVTLTAGGVSASDSFTIRPKSIASCTVSLSQNSFTYNGTAPALTVTVVDNGIGSSALTEDTDYTVGAVQVDAGSHKLTVTGKGNYTGTAQLDYTISKAASAISFTSAYDPSREYTGAALLDPTEPYMSITNAAFADVIITWYRGSVSDANKLPGAPKDAGTYYVVASIPDSGNVTGSSTTSRAIIIRPMVAGTDEVDITLAQEQFTYDGTAKTPAVVSVRYHGFDIPASEFEVSYSGNTNVGTATVTITDKPGGNFTVSGSATFQITKAAAVLTAPTANALTYTGAAQDLIAKGSTDHGTMVYSLTEDGGYSTTIPQGTDAGKYTVYYKVLGDSNHSDTDTKSLEVTIAKAQAVITVDTAPITVTYGDTLTLPTATTNFGTVVCDKTAAELVNAGTYTITYSVEGTANYAGAEKKLTVTVEKKAVAEPTVTGTYTYTGSELTVSLAGVESCMTVASGSKGVGAGSYEVLITLDADHTWADGSDGKIAWTIGKAQAAIDVDTDPITVTYGETLTLPAATSNFGTVVCDKTAADLKNAGTYTVTYTVPGTENYDGDTKSITVTVEVKTLYVYADHPVKTYGEADPTLTYTVEGLEDGDTLTGHLVREAGEDAGYYTITQGTLTASSNYQISFSSHVFWIQPKSLLHPDITLTVGRLVWNGQMQGPPITLKDGDKVLLKSNQEAANDYSTLGWTASAYAKVLKMELNGNGNYQDRIPLFWEVLPVFSAEAPATVDGKGKIVMESTLDGETVLEFASGADFADAADFDASGIQEAAPGTYYVRVKADPTWDTPAGTAVQVVVPKSYTGVIQQPQGGNVDIFPEAVVPGEDITVTVTPDKGKVIDDVTVTGPDGNEIPVTDNGDGSFTYEQPEGNVSIDVTFAIDTIQIVSQGEDPFQAGQKVEIDGISVPVDEDGEVWIRYSGSRLMTTYEYAVNDDGKEYPTAMYVWILKWTDEDGDGETDHCEAVPVSELDNFMLYKGTSIRVGHSSNGIRFFTAVPAEALDSLMKGQLLTGELEGYQLVEMGTLYKWAATGTELTTAVTAKSYVYGGNAGNSFRIFSKEGDSNWFTGMLTDLPGDAHTLDSDIISRPYAVLENEAGDQLTIYGGSIQRSIYYVATQNADTWAEGSAYDNYVENIISTVENANG